MNLFSPFLSVFRKHQKVTITALLVKYIFFMFLFGDLPIVRASRDLATCQ